MRGAIATAGRCAVPYRRYFESLINIQSNTSATGIKTMGCLRVFQTIPNRSTGGRATWVSMMKSAFR